MTKPHISVKNVYKKFRRNMTSFSSLMGYVVGSSSVNDFYGLQDVSFDLAAGDSLGVIGMNGAGKSTLLKILSKITLPTMGKVRVTGKVGALIEVGAGFHPELTGEENIYLYGAIMGMNRKEIKNKFDDIVAFSDLEQFLATPVKFYSSGMVARLGFSVIVHMDPDILLIDEALAVGDAAFREKCFKKIREFQKAGKIIVLVSHDLRIITEYTNKSILLDQGVIIYKGSPGEAAELYYSRLYSKHKEGHTVLIRDSSRPISISKVQILSDNIPTALFEHGSSLSLETTFTNKNLEQSKKLFGIAIFKDGHYVFGSKTEFELKGIEPKITIHIPSHPFLSGRYFVTVGLWDNNTEEPPIDFRDHLISFVVKPDEKTRKYDGTILVPHRYE